MKQQEYMKQISPYVAEKLDHRQSTTLLVALLSVMTKNNIVKSKNIIKDCLQKDNMAIKGAEKE